MSIDYMGNGMAERTSGRSDKSLWTCKPHGLRSGACAAARTAAFALAVAGSGFVAPAAAQTMGEYGGVTAHSAAAASSMPKIGAPDLGHQTNSAHSNPSGSSHTEEIRTYEMPSSARSSADDKDKDTGNSRGDWEQVK
jgi:hypothetical protein